MEERNYRKSMNGLKKLVYLSLTSMLAAILQHLALLTMVVLKTALLLDLLDLIWGIAILCIGFFVVHPLLSFTYSKILISNGHYRLLQSCLYPITSTLVYVISFKNGFPNFLYPIILFAWCELWSLLGLIKRKKDKEEKVLEK